ncbi:Alpha/Beta hydrolase protein [Hypoxylon crocopeplum]|nr:Alpha/Beta hydrolase protein [Hypoxylon crocopeplum]
MVRTTLRTILLAGLAGVATARNCKNLTVSLSLSALNTNFALQAPANDIDVTDFVLNLAQPGMNYSQEVLSTSNQFIPVSGNYTIGATWCVPQWGPGKVLQVLTHGIAFDRRYWDFAAQGHKYSYVDAALARGYSTFAYDRLGLGASSHGEPVNEIQTALEVAALTELTSMLRSTRVPGVTFRYPKVVHVGHSYGSVQSYALTAAHPELSDGVVLTGFSQALGSFVPYFLLGGNFVEAGGVYPPGYMASADVPAAQTNFFAPGNFDQAILEAAYEAGQPVTVGELMTIGSATTRNNSFGGPVLVITGERDVPFCGGNCLTMKPSIPAQTEQYFTNASYFESIVVPRSGHGLNLEYSAQDTYASILDFFDKNV